MAGKEAPKSNSAVDKGLDLWQKWNKLTLTAEGVAIAGGLLFGFPWLVMLGATGAAVDGIQIVAINEIQKSRKAEKMEPGKEYVLAA